MKISFFIGSMRGGGAERVISILANQYCAKGWDVEIALLLDTKVAYKLDSRIRILDLTGKHGSYFKNLPGWLLGIRRHCRESRPDRGVSFVGRINARVLTATVGMKTPIVVSERNDPKHDGRGPFMLWLCNQSYGRAATIVHQTRYEMSCFRKSLERKSRVIPNPIEVKAQPAAPVGTVVATAGRLLHQKNQAMLIDAAWLLQEEFPELKVYIYGEGALRNELWQQVDALQLQDTVCLPGSVTDLHQRISTASLFLMTSEFEGLSNALLEAMSLGLPCITTDYPGADELITDGVDGLIVPRKDAAALAQAIRRVLTEPELCRALRENAKKTSARYHKDVVLRLWEDVIG